MIVGGVGNGAAEEDWCWDLKPRQAAVPERGPRGFGGEGREDHAALAEWGPRSFGERGEPRVFGVLPFAMWLRKQERLCLEEKG